jgi:hypothetical protein
MCELLETSTTFVQYLFGFLQGCLDVPTSSYASGRDDTLGRIVTGFRGAGALLGLLSFSRSEHDRTLPPMFAGALNFVPLDLASSNCVDSVRVDVLISKKSTDVPPQVVHAFMSLRTSHSAMRGRPDDLVRSCKMNGRCLPLSR